jgi:hypothetical protein
MASAAETFTSGDGLIFSDNEAVQSALDLLVNNDWLAEQQIRTAGRPKITYLINPATF